MFRELSYMHLDTIRQQDFYISNMIQHRSLKIYVKSLPANRTTKLTQNQMSIVSPSTSFYFRKFWQLKTFSLNLLGYQPKGDG